MTSSLWSTSVKPNATSSFCTLRLNRPSGVLTMSASFKNWLTKKVSLTNGITNPIVSSAPRPSCSRASVTDPGSHPRMTPPTTAALSNGLNIPRFIHASNASV